MQCAMAWYLYLLECADGSYYAGITNKLDERIVAHNQGIGARYTRGNLSDNMAFAVELCQKHPLWRLSVQTHKMIGIR